MAGAQAHGSRSWRFKFANDVKKTMMKNEDDRDEKDDNDEDEGNESDEGSDGENSDKVVVHAETVHACDSPQPDGRVAQVKFFPMLFHPT